MDPHKCPYCQHVFEVREETTEFNCPKCSVEIIVGQAEKEAHCCHCGMRFDVQIGEPIEKERNSKAGFMRDHLFYIVGKPILCPNPQCQTQHILASLGSKSCVVYPIDFLPSID